MIFILRVIHDVRYDFTVARCLYLLYSNLVVWFDSDNSQVGRVVPIELYPRVEDCIRQFLRDRLRILYSQGPVGEMVHDV